MYMAQARPLGRTLVDSETKQTWGRPVVGHTFRRKGQGDLSEVILAKVLVDLLADSPSLTPPPPKSYCIAPTQGHNQTCH
jgi:hypothetical protein